MNVQEEMKKGNFIISKCPSCDQIIWPPSKICSTCLGNTEWIEGPNTGTIIEFSKKDDQVFCLVELDAKMKVIGTLIDGSEPKIGQKIRLARCNVNNQDYSFSIESDNNS